ncbi:MAG TPA: TonB-dependent receptor [Candidatus Eremiobacteraceae bacterium]|nr:TonB-dependent receptor [Candidatus Eremiobacteraceae bacterium]
MLFRRSRSLTLALAFVLAIAPLAANAGTTGNISGRTLDEHSAPVAAVKVTVTSPSQAVTTLSSAAGFYSILNLAPDTYRITAVKDGYATATQSGVTVLADQTSRVDMVMQPSVRTLGRVTTTAAAGIVSKSVTGDLYAVNAQAINSYQGSAGGAETLYSQNGVVGSLPGVTRTVGTGGGYAGNGSLSIRGGSNDQVGFELEGIPLNRSFDSANATAFLTNGLSQLQVYTGGEPADSGRSMAGYINEIIRRGSYPGGGDLTYVIGTPDLNSTIQADVYGASPNRHFDYYASTLWINSGYSFGNRSNLDNTVINVPANDPGCGASNALTGAALDCTMPHTLNMPISQGAWSSLLNPQAAMADTVVNLNWGFDHQGLTDNLQLLYNVGMTRTPFNYSGPTLDPLLSASGVTGSTGLLLYPTGALYTGALGGVFDPNAMYTLTWPSAGGSVGEIPPAYRDSQRTQSSIEKVSYTRALTSSSFLRLYGYAIYSLWNFDQATNGYLGDSFYDLHDNAYGLTLNYQNQVDAHNLVRLDVDYLQENSLRYNYANNFSIDGFVNCFLPYNPILTPNPYALGPNGIDFGCAANAGEQVAQINGPYAYWNSISPVTSDFAVADTWHPNDRLTFDIGIRYDDFYVPLMPLQITGPNGIAEQAQDQFGTCLHGYAYAANSNCNLYLTQGATDGSLPTSAMPGAGNWTNVSGSETFTYWSPRFGVTYSATARDVYRFSVGRYVQAPATAYEEYRGAPVWGPADTVSILNNFYDGIGFTALHNIQPQDSTNYDASWEHDFNNAMAMKISPFYRDTRNQILNIPVNPAMPTFETGYNFGAARISGAEFLLRDYRTSDGWSGTLAATYTNSKIRFTAPIGGTNFIDTMNAGISAYNTQYNTNYPLLNRNGFYSPSLFQGPTITGPSYDVAWVVNLNASYQTHGWLLSPTFNYQSGNPYGDPLLFPDTHCPATPYPGCIPNSTGMAPLTYGPDPYTNTFDAPGSLKGPWWLTMNFAISHDLMPNVKASILYTNVFTVVGNHGYPWELPAGNQVVSYEDGTFYANNPIGSFRPQYIGESYYPYQPSSINPYHQLIFSVSSKI